MLGSLLVFSTYAGVGGITKTFFGSELESGEAGLGGLSPQIDDIRKEGQRLEI